MPKSSRCACKGIRTCLLCEVLQDPLPKSQDELNSIKKQNGIEYLYDHCSCKAICKEVEQEHLKSFNFPGVEIFSEFVTSEEERTLIAGIDAAAWRPSQSGRFKQDFGPKVNFKKQKVNCSAFTGLPVYSKFLVERIKSCPSLSSFEPVEMCNLEYLPERGSAIDPHLDDSWLWGERLLTLNLLSDSWLTMTWNEQCKKSDIIREFENSGNISSEISVKIPLKTRSLVVLLGDARYKWKHGIDRNDISGRRVCCTFRELSAEFLTGSRRMDGERLLQIATTYSGKVVS